MPPARWVLAEHARNLGTLGWRKSCPLAAGDVEAPADCNGSKDARLVCAEGWSMIPVRELTAADFEADASAVISV